MVRNIRHFFLNTNIFDGIFTMRKFLSFLTPIDVDRFYEMTIE
jgi:hypothetical protein